MGFTNQILAEKDLLKEKLEYIEDCINDAKLEGASHLVFEQILRCCKCKCCNTCKWWEYEDITKGFVCCNADSSQVTEWTDGNFGCDKWEEIEFRWNTICLQPYTVSIESKDKKAELIIDDDYNVKVIINNKQIFNKKITNPDCVMNHKHEIEDLINKEGK